MLRIKNRILWKLEVAGSLGTHERASEILKVDVFRIRSCLFGYISREAATGTYQFTVIFAVVVVVVVISEHETEIFQRVLAGCGAAACAIGVASETPSPTTAKGGYATRFLTVAAQFFGWLDMDLEEVRFGE